MLLFGFVSNKHFLWKSGDFCVVYASSTSECFSRSTAAAHLLIENWHHETSGNFLVSLSQVPPQSTYNGLSFYLKNNGKNLGTFSIQLISGRWAPWSGPEVSTTQAQSVIDKIFYGSGQEDYKNHLSPILLPGVQDYRSTRLFAL